MIAAFVNGRLARAEHGQPAACPECRGEVLARLPAHAIRHWAHKPLPDGQTRDCSRDAGEMTEWHRAWQDERTDLACIEVAGEGFRADAINAGGIVIEFQHSRIAEEEIQRREKYWRKGVWVADGLPDDEGHERIRLEHHPDQDPTDPFWRFRWAPMPKLIYVATWPVWVDCGGRGLLQVTYARQGRGSGWLVERQWFVDEVVNGSRMVLKAHVVKSQASRTKARKAARARPEEDEDLSELPVHCPRPMPDEPCCGEHYPGIAGEPIVLACQLCSHSPTYWKTKPSIGRPQPKDTRA